MKYRRSKALRNGLRIAIAFFTVGVSASAFGFMGFGNSPNWREEVLLHDGRKIVVERSQTLGDKPTIDSHERMVLEEEWRFKNPANGQEIAWKVNHRSPPEGQRLMLMTLDVLKGTPYIAAVPAGCIAYNHWGRPNPPYVFFKFDGKAWQRIQLAEFPAEFKAANVVVGGRANPEGQSGMLLSVERVRDENRNLEPHLTQLARQSVRSAQTLECGEMSYDGKGGWLGIGWFRDQPTYEACMKYCERNQIKGGYCLCDRFFHGGN